MGWNSFRMNFDIRAATAGKAPKAWALPRFWVSICSYKKQLVKKTWGRIVGIAWLKFAVASLIFKHPQSLESMKYQYFHLKLPL